MGSRFAPAYAGLFMGWFEREHAWGRHAAKWIDYVIFWGRYIDDVIMIWDGPAPELMSYFDFLNDNPFNVQFTMEHDQQSINFLDVTFFIQDNTVHSRTHRKATSCNSTLHHNSSHPLHIIDNIPYGEMIRMRRNCSTEETFLSNIMETEQRFLERGYPASTLQKADRKVMQVKRKTTLAPTTVRNTTNRPLAFSTEFTDRSNKVYNILRKHWHLLSDVPTLQGSVTPKPKVCYRRGKNLRNILCPSYVVSPRNTNWLTTDTKGFYTCNDCNMCKLGRNRTKKFSFNGKKKYTIDHLINCNTKYVTYVLGYACNKMYVGSTKRALKVRIQEHVRARRNGDLGYPLTYHMQEKHGVKKTLGFLVSIMSRYTLEVVIGFWP
ncbi:uncharacterized protein LOC144828767 [Lissotriton helveticus]